MAKARKTTTSSKTPITKTTGLRLREAPAHKIYTLTMETYLAEGEGRRALLTRGETSISLNKVEALVLRNWLDSVVETTQSVGRIES